uniref:Uncharacterized protein n=1 Tax=Octactis speculum TaxID=3111310 RepID=A0A7S2H4P7_9STRA|mmetsp:Transcript_61356/g.84274  ORF Transcript_61356/g.84274 Transcript_61356/m.84274 type:complete len:265 (+) Transcript_61356:127-921(+)
MVEASELDVIRDFLEEGGWLEGVQSNHQSREETRELDMIRDFLEETTSSEHDMIRDFFEEEGWLTELQNQPTRLPVFCQPSCNKISAYSSIRNKNNSSRVRRRTRHHPSERKCKMQKRIKTLSSQSRPADHDPMQWLEYSPFQVFRVTWVGWPRPYLCTIVCDLNGTPAAACIESPCPKDSEGASAIEPSTVVEPVTSASCIWSPGAEMVQVELFVSARTDGHPYGRLGAKSPLWGLDWKDGVVLDSEVQLSDFRCGYVPRRRK